MQPGSRQTCAQPQGRLHGRRGSGDGRETRARGARGARGPGERRERGQRGEGGGTGGRGGRWQHVWGRGNSAVQRIAGGGGSRGSRGGGQGGWACGHAYPGPFGDPATSVGSIPAPFHHQQHQQPASCLWLVCMPNSVIVFVVWRLLTEHGWFCRPATLLGFRPTLHVAMSDTLSPQRVATSNQPSTVYLHAIVWTL
jgi:hypothetical protein